MILNGKATISLTALGGFIVGTITAGSFLVQVWRAQIDQVTTATIERQKILSAVSRVADDIHVIKIRQRWNASAIRTIAASMHPSVVLLAEPLEEFGEPSLPGGGE